MRRGQRSNCADPEWRQTLNEKLAPSVLVRRSGPGPHRIYVAAGVRGPDYRSDLHRRRSIYIGYLDGGKSALKQRKQRGVVRGAWVAGSATEYDADPAFCVSGKEMDFSFVRDDRGQDLLEYTLLLAFITLVCAAAYIGMGRTTSGLWAIVNSRLASANQVSSS